MSNILLQRLNDQQSSLETNISDASKKFLESKHRELEVLSNSGEGVLSAAFAFFEQESCNLKERLTSLYEEKSMLDLRIKKLSEAINLEEQQKVLQANTRRRQLSDCLKKVVEMSNNILMVIDEQNNSPLTSLDSSLKKNLIDAIESLAKEVDNYEDIDGVHDGNASDGIITIVEHFRNSDADDSLESDIRNTFDKPFVGEKTHPKKHKHIDDDDDIDDKQKTPTPPLKRAARRVSPSRRNQERDEKEALIQSLAAAIDSNDKSRVMEEFGGGSNVHCYFERFLIQASAKNKLQSLEALFDLCRTKCQVNGHECFELVTLCKFYTIVRTLWLRYIGNNYQLAEKPEDSNERQEWLDSSNHALETAIRENSYDGCVRVARETSLNIHDYGEYSIVLADVFGSRDALRALLFDRCIDRCHDCKKLRRDIHSGSFPTARLVLEAQKTK